MRTITLIALVLTFTCTVKSAAVSRRGLLDQVANNAHVIDHINLFNSIVNSNPQTAENSNANTKASGPGNNSIFQKQKKKSHHHRHHRKKHRHKHWSRSLEEKEKRGVVDESANQAHIVDHVRIANANVDSNGIVGENSNTNTKASGPGDNADLGRAVGEGLYQQMHNKRRLGGQESEELQKRGLLDNSVNGLDLIDHLSLINSMVNSNPQNSENRNANTKANGPGNNSNYAKQGGEGIYKKKHWRRGLIDNAVNNANLLGHISIFNSMVNSNPQDSENRN
ncbi:uncharacterized protein VTP21DRAFT_5626, partial [Calcarisporiella thermophila]|uniref:uncharacterized protein n=1 Tax=Calcarisporiella thermophila TaxID=911321 RepID=UPI0037425D26